jgi:hypothetical protein
VNTQIHRDDAEGVALAVKRYNGSGNILICWEHSQMTNISSAIGVTGYAENSGWAGIPVEYPHKRFDLIWEVPPPYTKIKTVQSEQVPGLDDGKTPNPPGMSAGLVAATSLQTYLPIILNILYLM